MPLLVNGLSLGSAANLHYERECSHVEISQRRRKAVNFS
jgi:hypothetical protein